MVVLGLLSILLRMAHTDRKVDTEALVARDNTVARLGMGAARVVAALVLWALTVRLALVALVDSMVKVLSAEPMAVVEADGAVSTEAAPETMATERECGLGADLDAHDGNALSDRENGP